MSAGVSNGRTRASTRRASRPSSALRDRFRAPETPYDELDGLADTNLAASVAAAGGGVVALGLGAALLVTW